MLSSMRRRRATKSTPRPAEAYVGPSRLDGGIGAERDAVLHQFHVYERELFSRAPTAEELAEYELRKERVRAHGRDCIRRMREEDGLPPLD